MTEPDKRKRINVSTPAVAADWLRTELGTGELSCLFRRKDLIVHTPRVGEAGYIQPTETEALRGVDHGPAQVQPVTTAQIKALVEVRYQVGKNREVEEDDGSGGTRKRKRWQSELFPSAAATSAVEGGKIGEGAPNLQELRSITHTPLLRPDGSVFSIPGYDRSTGALFLPDRHLVVPPIPDRPTVGDVKAAVELLLTPIAQFPFIEQAHRANWLGYAFSPVLRPKLPPPYQAILIDATNPGSGKGFLMGMLIRLHGGTLRGAMPDSNEEMRKQITSALVDTTAPFVVFDNVTGTVRSPALEALLTTDEWTDRWLGQNRDIVVPNDRFWGFTGNNARVGGDLARRTNPISLDPGVADPQKRTGFLLHPPTWMADNRGRYLAALLTVARAWILDGAPSDITRSDDYRDWSGAIRGLLAWAGIEGRFGGDVAGVAVDSSDDSEWGQFLAVVHDAFGDAEFDVKQLTERLGEQALTGGMKRIDTAVLPGDLAHKYALCARSDDGDFRKSLGWWFKNRAGRFANGWRVRRTNANVSNARVARYVVDAPRPSITVAEPEAACGFAVSPVSASPPAPNGSPASPAQPPLGLVFKNIEVSKTAESAKPQDPNRWPTNVHPAASRSCTRCGFGLDSTGHAVNCEQAA